MQDTNPDCWKRWSHDRLMRLRPSDIYMVSTALESDPTALPFFIRLVQEHLLFWNEGGRVDYDHLISLSAILNAMGLWKRITPEELLERMQPHKPLPEVTEAFLYKG